MAQGKKAAATATKAEAGAPPPYCGIIMPISEIDGYPASHWGEVRDILEASIRNAGFEPRLVSDADAVGVIHQRIIENLYKDPIVVCDVSGKNPNVMFELGLRLAFDKPTVIVKDEMTTYSFDTAPIEHLTYPRGLRHQAIVEFQEGLATKIAETYNKSQSVSNYTTFLGHFGDFTRVQIDTKDVSAQDFIVGELKSISARLERMEIAQLARIPVVRPSEREEPARGSGFMSRPAGTLAEAMASGSTYTPPVAGALGKAMHEAQRSSDPDQKKD